MNSSKNQIQSTEIGQGALPLIRVIEPQTSLNDLLPPEFSEKQKNRRSSSIVQEENKSKSSQSNYTISSKQYERLREELGCKICTMILEKPVFLTSCLHIFCYECIRKWEYTAKKESKHALCPLCNTVFTRKMFKPASSVDTIAGIHRQIR